MEGRGTTFIELILKERASVAAIGDENEAAGGCRSGPDAHTHMTIVWHEHKAVSGWW